MGQAPLAGARPPRPPFGGPHLPPQKAPIMNMIQKGVHFMAINLKGRSFLTLEDFTPAEIRYLLDLGHDLKAKRRAEIGRAHV